MSQLEQGDVILNVAQRETKLMCEDEAPVSEWSRVLSPSLLKGWLPSEVHSSKISTCLPTTASVALGSEVLFLTERITALCVPVLSVLVPL